MQFSLFEIVNQEFGIDYRRSTSYVVAKAINLQLVRLAMVAKALKRRKNYVIKKTTRRNHKGMA